MPHPARRHGPAMTLGEFDAPGMAPPAVPARELPGGHRALDRAAALAARVTGMPMAAIALFDSAPRFAAHAGVDLSAVPLAGSLSAHVAERRTPLVVSDTLAHPDFAGWPTVAGPPFIRSYAGAPLIAPDGRIFGTLCVFAPDPDPELGSEDIELLTTLAELVADGFERRRVNLALKDELASRRRIERQLKLQGDCTAAVAEERNVADALGALLRVLAGHVGAATGQAWLLDPEEGRCVLQKAWRRPEPIFDSLLAAMEGYEGPTERLTTGQALLAGRMVIVQDLGSLDPAAYPLIPIAREAGLRSLISIPFGMGGQRFGLTFMFDRDGLDLNELAGMIALPAGRVADLLLRKRSEERLALLQSVVLNATDAVLVTDARLRIVYANPAFERSTGHALADILNRSPNFLHGPETDRAAIRALKQALGRSRSVKAEMANYRRDGTIFWVEVDISPLFDGGGRLTHWIAIRHDVTARREAEEARRRSEDLLRLVVEQRTATLDALPAHVALVDGDGYIVFVNGPWRRFVEAQGKGDGDELVGAHYLDPNRPAHSGDAGDLSGDREIIIRGVEEVMERRTPLFEHEYECEVAGRRQSFRFMAAPISAGRKDGAVVMHVDMTQAREAAEHLIQAKEMAESANRAKSDFLANMSHELRTPLNAIIGLSEMIEGSILGPQGADKYVEYAGDIHRSGVHLLSIINDILDLAKIEARTPDLNEEKISPAHLVRGALRIVEPRASAAGIAINWDSAATVGASIMGDERLLKQVLINLLSNAVKFSSAGGAVTVETLLDAEGDLRFRVIDRGIGMAAEDIPLALEPFRQLGDTLDKRYEGTGLGLPLAKRFAEIHGGRLEIQSAEGEGATVELVLPAARVIIG